MPGSVDLVLIARQEAKLRHVAAELSEQFGVSAKVIVADLAKPDAPQKIADEIRQDSLAVYYATKAFVLSFTEAIANELAGTGVTVTALCPGPTQSEFQQRAHIENTRLIKGKFMGLMTSEAVARIGYRGLMQGKRLVIPGLINKIGVQSVRLSPRRVATQVARMLQES